MVAEQNDRHEKKDHCSRIAEALDSWDESDEPDAPADKTVTGILDERIANLREAIDEIDQAMAGRKKLNEHFVHQIDEETEEVKRHLAMLNPPWKTGFYPELEFLRLSFHKSLTSRAKDRRSEQLKYWENGVNLAKERRKFLDECKALLATKRRLDRA